MRFAPWGPSSVLIVLAAFAVGCGDDDEKKQFGEGCGGDDTCAEGLFCAKGTKAVGTCTMDCDLPDPCPAKFGERAFCHVDNVCMMDCDNGAACPDGTHCYTGKIPDYCVAVTPSNN